MSDENKEKKIPETPDTEKEKVDGEWKWDAAVPETAIDGITIGDLATKTDKEEKPAEEEKKTVKEEKKNKEKSAFSTAGAKKKDDGNCIICGKPRKNSGSDLYCVDCERMYHRTHFGIPQVLLAFLMVFFAVFGYIICVSNIQVSSYLIKAENYMEQKRYSDASQQIVEYSEKVAELDMGLNSFLDFFNSDPNRKEVDFFVDGNRSIRIQLEAYIECFSFDDKHVTTFMNAVNAEFKDGLPKTKEYEKIRKMYDFCVGVKAYMNSTQEKWYGFMYTDEGSTQQKIKYDEAIAFLDSQPNDTLAQKASNGFFRLVAETFAETDLKVHYEILDKLYTDLGDYGYIFDATYIQIAWKNEDYAKCVSLGDRMYERNLNDITGYYYAIRSNIMQNDLDAADKRCEQLLADNAECLDYYAIKAEILRRRGQFQESVDICKTGIAIGMDAQIYNQQAISYMLLNDKEGALEATKSAYELALQTVNNNEVALEIVNTTALIAFLCEDTKFFEEVEALFKDLEIDFEENVSKCMKGDITFEDIYMEGRGDV